MLAQCGLEALAQCGLEALARCGLQASAQRGSDRRKVLSRKIGETVTAMKQNPILLARDGNARNFRGNKKFCLLCSGLTKERRFGSEESAQELASANASMNGRKLFPFEVPANPYLPSKSTARTFAQRMMELNATGIPKFRFLFTKEELLCTAIYLTIVGILATVGNGLFLATILHRRRFRRDPHMQLLMNLAASDLLVSFLGYPFTTVSGYYGYWVFSDVLCQVYAFVCFATNLSSMATQVAICLFRYEVIFRPSFKKRLSGKLVCAVISFVWVFSVLWTLPPLLGLWSRYVQEPFYTSCSIDWDDTSLSAIVYIVATITFCYLFSIVLVATLYTIVLRHVMRYHPTNIHAGGMAVRSGSSISCGNCLGLKPMELHLLKFVGMGPGNLALAIWPWQSGPGNLALAIWPWQSGPGNLALAIRQGPSGRETGRDIVGDNDRNAMESLRTIGRNQNF
ncbi:unnamed protein product [Darwinula stevensoni]|uniref:G-protein coupled receptors family 1 profile domain-containing protein n=1 Tax=Darwinula stevensoni TaxID=69355 RepID=A0A7R9FPQ1_9CRUS|nr:unnamed protein product [Darwinula stevensoni]CAG0898270.1 unnamed protein product [Darwinula stevensoni]